MRDDELTTAKILIVDDQLANVRLLERLLETAGYRQLSSTTDAREALARDRAFQPDLILLDLLMPHLDGVAVLEQLAAARGGGAGDRGFVPVIVLTADVTAEAKQRALAAGANDFLTKPFEALEVLPRIGNLLKTRRLYLTLEAQNRALDRTVQERTERLLQSEKVATMGTLLAGVAHELNNPLQTLLGQAELLRESLADPQYARRAEKIEQAAERCVRIVRNFLTLARHRTPARSRIVLADVVAGAVELLAYELRSEGVEVTVDVAPDLPALVADPHQIQQVLVNLMANAQHAMRRQARPRRLGLVARHDAGRHVVTIRVTDSGAGIPGPVLARIFEPFFTTKPVGEGTGLGLSLCRGMIEDHGGTIAAESVVGEGTTFTLELPVAAGDTSVAAAPTGGSLPPAPPRTVLVIDDEADVADVIAEALRRDGHTADVAANGATALDMLGRRAYDVVVSDTKMPVMDGEAFFEEVSRRFPHLRDRFLFLTGDVLSREKREFLERTGAPALSKPCDLAEVRRTVRRLGG
jgi:signal transduction histidine kinase